MEGGEADCGGHLESGMMWRGEGDGLCSLVRPLQQCHTCSCCKQRWFMAAQSVCVCGACSTQSQSIAIVSGTQAPIRSCTRPCHGGSRPAGRCRPLSPPSHRWFWRRLPSVAVSTQSQHEATKSCCIVVTALLLLTVAVTTCW
jgi:hypothetical protein